MWLKIKKNKNKQTKKPTQNKEKTTVALENI